MAASTRRGQFAQGAFIERRCYCPASERGQHHRLTAARWVQGALDGGSSKSPVVRPAWACTPVTPIRYRSARTGRLRPRPRWRPHSPSSGGTSAPSISTSTCMPSQRHRHGRAVRDHGGAQVQRPGAAPQWTWCPSRITTWPGNTNACPGAAQGAFVFGGPVVRAHADCPAAEAGRGASMPRCKTARPPASSQVTPHGVFRDAQLLAEALATRSARPAEVE